MEGGGGVEVGDAGSGGGGRAEGWRVGVEGWSGWRGWEAWRVEGEGWRGGGGSLRAVEGDPLIKNGLGGPGPKPTKAV